jgi:hypothetical protein
MLGQVFNDHLSLLGHLCHVLQQKDTACGFTVRLNVIVEGYYPKVHLWLRFLWLIQ